MVEGSPSFLPSWSWRLQGTLKKGGNLHTPDYYLENTGLREQNFSAALNYRTLPRGLEVYYSQFHSKLGILAPAHVGGLSDLQAALASEASLWVQIPLDLPMIFAGPISKSVIILPRSQDISVCPMAGS